MVGGSTRTARRHRRRPGRMFCSNCAVGSRCEDDCPVRVQMPSGERRHRFLEAAESSGRVEPDRRNSTKRRSLGARSSVGSSSSDSHRKAECSMHGGSPWIVTGTNSMTNCQPGSAAENSMVSTVRTATSSSSASSRRAPWSCVSPVSSFDRGIPGPWRLCAGRCKSDIGRRVAQRRRGRSLRHWLVGPDPRGAGGESVPRAFEQQRTQKSPRAVAIARSEMPVAPTASSARQKSADQWRSSREWPLIPLSPMKPRYIKTVGIPRVASFQAKAICWILVVPITAYIDVWEAHSERLPGAGNPSSIFS